jgi:hypothetical protein
VSAISLKEAHDERHMCGICRIDERRLRAVSLLRYRVAVAVAVVAVVVGLVTSVVLGGCDTLIFTESGGVPMKCHWTFRATALVFAAGLLLTALQLTLATREGRRFAAIAIIVVACIAALLPTEWVIGICADGGTAEAEAGASMGMTGSATATTGATTSSATATANATANSMALCSLEGMDCHTSAPLVWACSALLILVELVLCVRADPAAANRPRLED